MWTLKQVVTSMTRKRSYSLRWLTGEGQVCMHLLLFLYLCEDRIWISNTARAVLEWCTSPPQDVFQGFGIKLGSTRLRLEDVRGVSDGSCQSSVGCVCVCVHLCVCACLWWEGGPHSAVYFMSPVLWSVCIAHCAPAALLTIGMCACVYVCAHMRECATHE